MDYYIEIKIQPDAEMRENVLLNKVYTKLHKTLCGLTSTDIGVSFPDYKIKIGRMIRIHSTKSRLEQLNNLHWLGGLIGYCKCSKTIKVPENHKNIVISRKQSTMTQAKLKRLIKRKNISETDIKQYKAKMFSNGLDNPYLELESASTLNKYRRYIQFSHIKEQKITGTFDQFGLSKQATVPWF